MIKNPRAQIEKLRDKLTLFDAGEKEKASSDYVDRLKRNISIFAQNDFVNKPNMTEFIEQLHY